jgi:hypothetical protein
MINTNNREAVLSNSEREVKIDYSLLDPQTFTSALYWFDEWLREVESHHLPEDWNGWSDRRIQIEIVSDFEKWFSPFEMKAHQLGLGGMLDVFE